MRDDAKPRGNTRSRDKTRTAFVVVDSRADQQEDAHPLVPIAHGRDLARKIAGATAEFVAGMGHDLPRPVCERLAHALVRHAQQERAAGRTIA